MMKITCINALLLPALAFALAACTDDAAPEATVGGALQVRSVLMSEPAATRAVAATQLSEIGVYVTNSTHAALTTNAQSVFKLQSGTWSSDTPPDITFIESAPGRIYAFGMLSSASSVTPSTVQVNHSGEGNHTIPVQIVADNFDASLQTDYLYAADCPKSVHVNSRAVSFEMKHALAKVSFRVLKSQNVSETLTLTRIELVSSTGRLQLGNNGTLSLKDGTMNGLASTASISLTGSKELQTLLDQPNVSALVAPMTGEETRLSFRLTVNVTETGGGTTTRTFETAAVKPVQWKAGYHYVYAIKVDKMGGSLTNVQIDAWKNDANQNTGIGI